MKISRPLLALFAAYSASYVRRHFHSMRVLAETLPGAESGRPLVLYSNHASWWDPLVALLLARRFFPGRNCFGPIDAAALKQYPFLERLGLFGIGPRGGREFLRRSHEILANPDNILWLTPQGRFADVRDTTAEFQRGIGALAESVPGAVFMPVALEYPFWTERLPEILVAFGKPVRTGETEMSKGEWTLRFREALLEVQQQLAAAAVARDFSSWVCLQRGRAGVNGVYDAWRGISARLRGARFSREHMAELHHG